MKALIVVDYSNDFVADDGALTAGKPAQELEAYIAQTMQDFIDNGDFVVVANDLHYRDDIYHPETKLFVPHNIAGTSGRDLYGKVGEVYAANADKENVFYTPKRHYSAFVGTQVDLRLRERDIKEVWIVGVVTDICIMHTAIDAYDLGYKIVIPEAGVASFDPEGHKFALNHFKNTLGAKVIYRDEQ